MEGGIEVHGEARKALFLLNLNSCIIELSTFLKEL